MTGAGGVHASRSTLPVNSSNRPLRSLRLLPLGIGAAAMIVGLWAGLVRIGLSLPTNTPVGIEFHGALMIVGFLGTLICLERAVAAGAWWAYCAPALSAAGVIALMAGAPALSIPAFLLAGVILTVTSAVMALRHPALFTVILALGAACWMVGTAYWLARGTTFQSTEWWLAFLVLTIVAERLELSRLLAPPPFSQGLLAAAVMLVIGGSIRGDFVEGGAYLTGAGLVFISLWLLKYDIAFRTVRQKGQVRFSACCMIAGYVWLIVAGLLLLIMPPGSAPFASDVAIHAITIGFVFSMIFGHVPIILPALTGARVGFSPAAYGPLAMLHLAVLLRLMGGLLDSFEMRIASALLMIVALVSYALVLVIASWRR
jgi:hypothetical protein